MVVLWVAHLLCVGVAGGIRAGTSRCSGCSRVGFEANGIIRCSSGLSRLSQRWLTARFWGSASVGGCRGGCRGTGGRGMLDSGYKVFAKRKSKPGREVRRAKTVRRREGSVSLWFQAAPYAQGGEHA